GAPIGARGRPVEGAFPCKCLLNDLNCCGGATADAIRPIASRKLPSAFVIGGTARPPRGGGFDLGGELRGCAFRRHRSLPLSLVKERRESPVTKLEEHAMRRDRHTPPTPSSVRGLATRRGYLLAADQRATRTFKLISLVGRAATMPSRDDKHRYSWKLADADAWLRKQPLLSDR